MGLKPGDLLKDELKMCITQYPGKLFSFDRNWSPTSPNFMYVAVHVRLLQDHSHAST